MIMQACPHEYLELQRLFFLAEGKITLEYQKLMEGRSRLKENFRNFDTISWKENKKAPTNLEGL